MIPSPVTSTLFPYTTLFRSSAAEPPLGLSFGFAPTCSKYSSVSFRSQIAAQSRSSETLSRLASGFRASRRSEEHTSELQSQSNLVCRLLLEKKKNINS